ncbi:MAG: hypothetical protein HQM13_00545 [SAR324 cluster bacterium]|nr:hypothetical protein [SAR324 cluster bacterium]
MANASTDILWQVENSDQAAEKALKLYEKLEEQWASIGINILGKENKLVKSEDPKTLNFDLFNRLNEIRKKHYNRLNQKKDGSSPSYAQTFSWLAQAFEHNEGRPPKQDQEFQKCLDQKEPFSFDVLKRSIKDRIDQSTDQHIAKGLNLFLKKLEDGEFQHFSELLESIEQFNQKQALFSFPHMPTVLLSMMEKILLGSEQHLKEIYFALLRKIVDSAQVMQTLQNSRLSHTGVYRDPDSIKDSGLREKRQKPDEDECIDYTDFENTRVYLNSISIVLAECLTKEFREKTFKACSEKGQVPSMINVLDHLMMGTAARNELLENEIKMLVSKEGKDEATAKKWAKRRLKLLVQKKLDANKKEIFENIKSEKDLRRALKNFNEEYYSSLKLYLYMLRRYQFLKSFIVGLYAHPPEIDPEITDLIFITAFLANKQKKPGWDLISMLLNAQVDSQKKKTSQEQDVQFESELTQISEQHNSKQKIMSLMVPFLNELVPLEIDDMVKFLSKMFILAAPAEKTKEVESRFSATAVNSIDDPLIQTIMSLSETTEEMISNPDREPQKFEVRVEEETIDEENGNIVMAVSQFVREQCVKIIGNSNVVETDEDQQETVFKRVQKNCHAEAKALRRHLHPMKLDENFAYSKMMTSSQPALTPADQYKGHIIPLKYQNDLRACLRIYFDELGADLVKRVYLENPRGDTVCDEVVALQIPNEYSIKFGFQKHVRYSLILGLINFDDDEKHAVLRLYMVLSGHRPHDKKPIEGYWIEKNGESKKVIMISITEKFKQQALVLQVLGDELARTCSQTAWNTDSVQKILKSAQARQRNISKTLKERGG